MSIASASFAGFPPEAIQFLADLAANNDRTWFQPRKREYELLLKEPLEALVIAVGERARERGVPVLSDPARSPFRIYRDVRFSKDKSPYKTNVGASFPWRGAALDEADGQPTAAESRTSVGGYFHLAPGDIFVGGGMWHPEPARLAGWRRLVTERREEVHAAIDDPTFTRWFGELMGHSLTRVPSGFDRDDPDADLLKLKDVGFAHRLSDEEICSPGLPDLIAEAFAAGTPVFRLLASLPAGEPTGHRR